MLQSVSSTVRRRSASLLVHDERCDFTSCGDKRLSYPAFQGNSPCIEGLNSVGEQDKHLGGYPPCGEHPCDNCRLSFCALSRMPGEGHVSYHQEDSGCPPAFDDLQHSASATTPKSSDDSPTSTRTDCDYRHPKLLPSGQSKFTQKWPAPSTLKYLPISASYESVNPPTVPSLEHGQGSTLPHSGRWTPSKVTLLLSGLTVFAYGTMLLLWASVTWFDAWAHADVMAVADHDILVLITVAATLLVFSSMIGISGTMLNSRPLLAVYALLLWPDQATILAVGYVAYKRVTFNFDRKMNFAWSHLYTVQGRQVIQDSFGCCGFYNTMHEAAPSKRCYIRASIPGCRDALFDFERTHLAIVWKVAFALAAIHILNVIIALLCSNHVTNTFGKGLTPPQYRLCSDDIKAETRGVGVESGLVLGDDHRVSQDRTARGEVHRADSEMGWTSGN